jgi:alkylated DNA repair dioxygenase AlkB
VVPGLTYLPDYIDPATHDRLVEAIDAQPWLTRLKRRVQHYGWIYDYKARAVDPAQYLGPLPDWAAGLATRLREGFFPDGPDQLIVNEYEPGQGISAHVDQPQSFGPTVASLSLGSTCVMELTHAPTGQMIPLLLEPRSLLVLQGEARYDWRHAIPARKSDTFAGQTFPRARRLSLTFRRVLVRQEPGLTPP